MLTVRQLLVAAGGNAIAAMHADELLQTEPRQPLSIASMISAYQNQGRIYFVRLISPDLFLAPEVHSYSDFVTYSSSSAGQMRTSDVKTLANYLLKQGILLRFVETNLQTAALVGTVESFVSIPTVVVNDSSFIKIRDVAQGATTISSGLALACTTTLALGAFTGPVAPIFWVVGAGLYGISAFLVTGGIIQVVQDAPEQKSKDHTSTPNGARPGGKIELPSAVAVGQPPFGVDMNRVLEVVGRYARVTAEELTVEELLGLPAGWDSDRGEGLPDYGSGGGSDGEGFPGGLWG